MVLQALSPVFACQFLHVQLAMERKKMWKVLECIFTSDTCGVHMRDSARKYEREEGSVGLGWRASQLGSELLSVQESVLPRSPGRWHTL